MASERLSAQSEYSEEERAFLQTRVALFWKSLFIIARIASGLGAIGTIVQPGLDSLLNFASAVHWCWTCAIRRIVSKFPVGVKERDALAG